MRRGYPAILRGVTLDEVIEHVAFEFGLTAAAIVGPGDRTYPRQARFAVAWLADRHTRAGADGLAATLGRSARTAGEALRLGEALRCCSAEFRGVTDRLDAMLAILGEERAGGVRAAPPRCATTTVPADVARLVRAARALGDAVALPFIAERAELDAALAAFARRVSTATPAVAA